MFIPVKINGIIEDKKKNTTNSITESKEFYKKFMATNLSVYLVAEAMDKKFYYF